MTRPLFIDLSHYEPALASWARAKAAGVVGMHTKATDGANSVDAMLKTHTDGAKSVGIPRGAYLFMRASQDAQAQVDLFLKTVAPLNLEMAPVLDWELSDGQSSAVQKVKALLILKAMEAATGKTPVIYGAESYISDLQLGPEFARYKLWSAHYTTNEANLRVPAPFPAISLWQCTDSASVAGVAAGHHVDASWFMGSAGDLANFLKGA
jgi:lysozyme